MKRLRGYGWIGRGLYTAGVILLVLSIASCGYRFAGEEPQRIDPSLRTVFVEAFANRTSEANAANIFRTAFISRFVQEGRFKLAGSRGEADVVCQGTVRGLQASPLSYKATNFSAEDRLSVTLEISLEDRGSGKTLWSDKSLIGTGDYPVTTVGMTETSRKNALVKLANDTAERAYRLMMSGF
jgi:hypothetical protein